MLRRGCATAARAASLCRPLVRWQRLDLKTLSPESIRDGTVIRAFSCTSNNRLEHQSTILENFKKSLSFPPATRSLQDLARNGSDLVDEQVVLHGYLGTRRDASKSLTFAEYMTRILSIPFSLSPVLFRVEMGPTRPMKLSGISKNIRQLR